MNKWKCEICGMEFENFHAQGFEHKIYCPLCYFKELYRQTELERERLQNVIDTFEEELEREANIKEEDVSLEHNTFIDINSTLKTVLKRFRELKEGNKYE